MWSRKQFSHFVFVLSIFGFFYALLGFGMLSAYAQPQPARDGRVRSDELLNTLKLNTTQSTQVQNILDSERQAMHALNESVRPQRDAIHQSTRKKLATTLTPEQLRSYDAWLEENRPPPPDSGAPKQTSPTSNKSANPPPKSRPQ